MSELARQQAVVALAYMADHPEVDWNTHEVLLRETDYGYEVVGHRLKDPAAEAMLDCCCHPDQLRATCKEAL